MLLKISPNAVFLFDVFLLICCFFVISFVRQHVQSPRQIGKSAQNAKKETWGVLCLKFPYFKLFLTQFSSMAIINLSIISHIFSNVNTFSKNFLRKSFNLWFLSKFFVQNRKIWQNSSKIFVLFANLQNFYSAFQ